MDMFSSIPCNLCVTWKLEERILITSLTPNIRDCYMKSCLSSLVLSSSFSDLVVQRKKEN